MRRGPFFVWPGWGSWPSSGGSQLQFPPKLSFREGTRSAAFARLQVFSAKPRFFSSLKATSAATGPLASRSRMATLASSSSDGSSEAIDCASSCSAVCGVSPEPVDLHREAGPRVGSQRRERRGQVALHAGEHLLACRPQGWPRQEHHPCRGREADGATPASLAFTAAPLRTCRRTSTAAPVSSASAESFRSSRRAW